MKINIPNKGPIPTPPGKTPFPTPTPSPKLSPMQIADIGFRAADSITRLITTISEERVKTQALKVESKRISAELEAKIAEEENKTARYIEKCRAEIAMHADKTRERIKEIEKEIAEGQNLHEREMQRQRDEHEARMFFLQIIKSIVDTSLAQYTFYNIKNSEYTEGPPIIDIQKLNALNNTIMQLGKTIATISLPAQQL